MWFNQTIIDEPSYACRTMIHLMQSLNQCHRYDQGVVSIVLVMPQFLARFTRVSETASGAGFWKGLLTAMIELGAFIGALNQGWVADKISRKYSIVVAVIVFTVGSVLQTAAVDYSMLVVARLIGGIGIGMLSMVAPLYISEISPVCCPPVLFTLITWQNRDVADTTINKARSSW